MSLCISKLLLFDVCVSICYFDVAAGMIYFGRDFKIVFFMLECLMCLLLHLYCLRFIIQLPNPVSPERPSHMKPLKLQDAPCSTSA